MILPVFAVSIIPWFLQDWQLLSPRFRAAGDVPRTVGRHRPRETPA